MEQGDATVDPTEDGPEEQLVTRHPEPYQPDTGDLIDVTAPDPTPQPVTDPDDPSYVEPDPSAVPVNADLLLPADPPPASEAPTAEYMSDARYKTRQTQDLTDLETVELPPGDPAAAVDLEPAAGQPRTLPPVGTSLPDAPDTSTGGAA